MELGPIPGYTLYSRGQITLATLLGGPLGGCVLMAQNYRRVGSQHSSRAAIGYGLLSMVALVIVAFILPQGFPHAALPAAYTFAMRQTSDLLQSNMYANHMKSFGRKSSWWAACGTGSACLVLTIGVFFAAALILPEGLSSK